MTDAEHNPFPPEIADEELIRAYCAFEVTSISPPNSRRSLLRWSGAIWSFRGA